MYTELHSAGQKKLLVCVHEHKSNKNVVRFARRRRQPKDNVSAQIVASTPGRPR